MCSAPGKQVILHLLLFTKQKKDGTVRTILNLKCLNEFVQYQHFKVESLLDVFKIIKLNVWMASVDLKDELFTVPVNESHQKYFKFEWIDKVCKFVGMPNGYSDAMRIFTRILKPVYANLRKKGHLCVVFYLELEAIYLAVKSYRSYWLDKKRIQVKPDNTTAIAYIYNMGGRDLFPKNVMN